ncbi:hypothetical protein MCHK_12535 (plasmid) [Mesorhizobium huakuii 7653R]|nr:hypothetical protein MCHK_12535 [Mesorhizobium huakuii 7653R]
MKKESTTIVLLSCFANTCAAEQEGRTRTPCRVSLSWVPATQTTRTNVAYDDDEMVFFQMAAIGRNKDGKSLRPDLEHSAELGGQFQE